MPPSVPPSVCEPASHAPPPSAFSAARHHLTAANAAFRVAAAEAAFGVPLHVDRLSPDPRDPSTRPDMHPFVHALLHVAQRRAVQQVPPWSARRVPPPAPEHGRRPPWPRLVARAAGRSRGSARGAAAATSAHHRGSPAAASLATAPSPSRKLVAWSPQALQPLDDLTLKRSSSPGPNARSPAATEWDPADPNPLSELVAARRQGINYSST